MLKRLVMLCVLVLALGVAGNAQAAPRWLLDYTCEYALANSDGTITVKVTKNTTSLFLTVPSDHASKKEILANLMTAIVSDLQTYVRYDTANKQILDVALTNISGN